MTKEGKPRKPQGRKKKQLPKTARMDLEIWQGRRILQGGEVRKTRLRMRAVDMKWNNPDQLPQFTD